MRPNRLASVAGLAAALTLASSSFGQASTMCNADASGIETHTTFWEQNRPLSLEDFARGSLGGPWAGPFGERGGLQFVSLNVDPEGDLPREVAVTPDGTTALVVNQGTLPLAGGTVTFIDTITRTPVASVGVGQLPVNVAISPNGQYAVTVNVLSNDVSIIDVQSRTLVATVPVTGTQPIFVAITSDSQFAVVGVTNDAISSALSVINLASAEEVRTIPTGSQGTFGFYGTPEFAISGTLHTYFALTPDGTRVVLPVSQQVGSRVEVYNIATGAQLANIPVAGSPRSIDISSDGSRAIIGHEGSVNALSVLDLTSNSLQNVWTTPASLFNQVVRITPDNAYAIVGLLNEVAFINLATGASDPLISTGTPGDIVIVDGTSAFVSNFNSRVLNLATRSLVATIPFAPTVESAVANTTPRRVVALNSRFREDVHFYRISGASSVIEGFTPSGPQPEGDCTKPLAVSSDGATIVAGNTISRNASIIDTATGTIRATVPTGDRVAGVAITPDGNTAIVTNSDANTVSILNLSTNASVATLSISQRPWEVRIRPNSTQAAILSVAGTDLIHWVNIAGAGSSVIGTTIAGQTGSNLSYSFAETSAIEFSPDGSLLAVCRSFDDQVRLIDATTRQVLADVSVGDFPQRIEFSPDGTRAWVTNSFSDDISVLAINGASSSLVTTIAGIDTPFRAIVDPAGQFVYVNNVGTLPRVSIIDAQSNGIVGSVVFPGAGVPRDMALVDGKLHVAGRTNAGGFLWTINATGPTSSLESSQPLTSEPFNLRAGGNTIAISLPNPDGVDVLRLGSACDGIDFNNDGGVFDPTDIDAFLSVYSEGPCIPASATCNDIDFNNDAGLFDPCDIDSFLLVFSEGPCTPCGF